MLVADEGFERVAFEGVEEADEVLPEIPLVFDL